MAQLDRFLSAMVSHRASALHLDETALAELEISGAARPVTKAPLTAAQVVSLLREVAPANSSEALAAGQPTSFGYVSDEGAFAIDATRNGGRWQVRITIDEGRERDRLVDHARDLGGARGAVAEAPPAAETSSNASLRLVTATHGAISSDADAIAHFDGADRARAMLDALLRAMVEKGASDLHLRCGEPPILRLHGEMHRLDEPALEPLWLDAMLRSIMPERNRREYSDSNDTDYAYELEGVARFRANALKDRRGPAAVFRQIPATVVTVEQMGITPEVQKLCQLNKGLVLVTGPTGSGKSTTLCSLIDLVNRSRSDHVITIEDPIEFVHPNKKCIITQRQVGVHTGSFKSALRAALREDPDIILVGELRDLETVSIAIETAETGHLVFGTLHTTTAAGTIDRIIDQFPADRQSQIRVMLAESLKGVISQTLCKKIGGGRVAAREVLLSITAVTNLIREGKTFQIPTVMQTSKRLGMVTLNDALLELVDGGLIEPMEGYSKAVDKTMFLGALKARGLDTSFAETEPAPKESPKPAAAAGGKR
ncbi:MAG TPA: type IV pilus twitching motility protein PilT [Gemmatimonadaceae bacterium]